MFPGTPGRIRTYGLLIPSQTLGHNNFLTHRGIGSIEGN